MNLLEKKYKPYLEAFRKGSPYYKELREHVNITAIENTLLKNLHNTKTIMKLYEDNGSISDMGLLPKIALEVITAAYAKNIIPLLAGVQPIDEPKGYIWYKNVVSQSTRGNVTAGDTLLSGKEGRKIVPNSFASEVVSDEVLGAGDGATTNFTGNFGYAPVRERTVEIVAIVGGVEIKAVDDGNGGIVGFDAASGVSVVGTIDYNTGAFNITYSVAPDNATNVLAYYGTNLEQLTEIPTVKVQLETIEVTARPFALRNVIGYLKAYMMQKRLGTATSMDEIIAQDLINELNAEITGTVVATAYAGIPSTQTITWDAAAPSGVSAVEHRLDFFNALARLEGAILKAAGRPAETYTLVVGNKVAPLIASLPGFKSQVEGSSSGNHLFGFLNGTPIIRSITIPEDEVIMIGRDTSSPFGSNAVYYCPYLPITITGVGNTVDYNPLVNHRAVVSMAAIKKVIPGFVAKLQVLNL